MKKPPSKFLAWFIEQHGPRTRTPALSDDRLIDRIKCGKRAEQEIASRRDWDHRKTSALAAWMAETRIARIREIVEGAEKRAVRVGATTCKSVKISEWREISELVNAGKPKKPEEIWV